MTDEPSHEKTNNLGFRPGPTQTGLYCHRSRLKSWDFGFKKKRDCTIHVVKTTRLSASQCLSAPVFAYPFCWFSHAASLMIFKIEPYFITHDKCVCVLKEHDKISIYMKDIYTT